MQMTPIESSDKHNWQSLTAQPPHQPTDQKIGTNSYDAQQTR